MARIRRILSLRRKHFRKICYTNIRANGFSNPRGLREKKSFSIPSADTFFPMLGEIGDFLWAVI